MPLSRIRAVGKHLPPGRRPMKSTSPQTSPSPSRSSWPAHPPTPRPLAIPKRLCIPLTARNTADVPSLKPIGTHLAPGQPLLASPFPSSHVPLSPVSGRIVGLSHATLLNGRTVPVADLEPDPSASPPSLPASDRPRPVTGLWENLQYSHLPAWIDRLHGAGIWADRCTSPNLTDQLNRILRQPVDTVICTVLDSDPSARFNSLLAAQFSTDVVAAVMLLSKLTNARNRWVVLESGTPPRWWKHLRYWARRLRITLIPLPNDYPQADPTLLLYTLLDRRLSPGQSPIDQGVLLADAAAMCALGDYILDQRPMLQVPLAVYDHIRRQTHLLLAPVGMPLHDALAQLHFPADDPFVIRSGDLLRNRQITPDSIIAGSELTVHVMRPEHADNPEPCIRCGWCVETCPSRAQPAGLLEAAQRNNLALAHRHGLDACIECGICSYVCPAKLPLLDGIRKLKGAEPGR